MCVIRWVNRQPVAPYASLPESVCYVCVSHPELRTCSQGGGKILRTSAVVGACDKVRPAREVREPNRRIHVTPPSRPSAEVHKIFPPSLIKCLLRDAADFISRDCDREWMYFFGYVPTPATRASCHCNPCWWPSIGQAGRRLIPHAVWCSTDVSLPSFYQVSLRPQPGLLSYKDTSDLTISLQSQPWFPPNTPPLVPETASLASSCTFVYSSTLKSPPLPEPYRTSRVA